MILAGAAATGIGLLVVFWGFAMPARARAARPIEERISYYGVRPEVEAGDDLEGSLLDRLLTPQVERLRAATARWTPSGHHERLSRDLALAGNPLHLTATDFVVVRAAAAVVAAVMGAVIGGWIAGSLVLALVGAVTLAGAVWLGSEVWLRSAVRGRREEVSRALPNALDFMVVAMQAGMQFEGALARVVEKSRNPLTDELAKMQAEVDLGRPRQEALEALARRLGVDEVSRFVQTVVSAAQMGVPMVDALRVQAEEARWRRRDRVRTLGAEAPIKMTIPMVLFIFPTLWIILLGPSLLEIMGHGI